MTPLTIEQKLALRTLQYQMHVLKARATDLQTELGTVSSKIDNTNREFMTVVQSFASDLALDPGTVNFNCDTLEFVPVAQE